MKAAVARFIHALGIQFLKYLVGGASYFWSGYLIFAFFYTGVGWNWLPAKMVADVLGWTINYLIQRYWAFDSSSVRRHEGMALARYVGITAFNLLLDYLIVGSLNSIGISPYAGFFISAAFFTVWNYLWYKSWVFAATRNHKEEPTL